jgi:hypothetical protein
MMRKTTVDRLKAGFTASHHLMNAFARYFYTEKLILSQDICIKLQAG